MLTDTERQNTLLLGGWPTAEATAVTGIRRRLLLGFSAAAGMSIYAAHGRGLIVSDSPASKEAFKLASGASPESTGRRLWLGLGGPQYYDRDNILIDVFKKAGEWGAQGGDNSLIGPRDENGYPLSLNSALKSIRTVLMAAQGPATEYLNGRYALTWDGAGAIQVSGVIGNIVKVNANRIEFDFTANDDGVVVLDITAITAGDHIRNMRCFRTDFESLLNAGRLARPDYEWRNVGLMRFMDMMCTNDSSITQWSGRAHPAYYSWSQRGWPVEAIVQLANEYKVHPWVCIPHKADDDYIRRFAVYVRDSLNPELKCHVEWSNEVWNWGGTQAHWCRDQAVAMGWGEKSFEYAGARAAQCMNIWARVFAGQVHRIVRVGGTQTAWLGLESAFFESPPWVKMGNPAPYLSFDAYAVTGYFDAGLSNGEGATAMKAYLNSHSEEEGMSYAEAQCMDASIKQSIPDIVRQWRYHRKISSTRYGLKLLMYEGGTHIVANGDFTRDPVLLPFFTKFNYSTHMGRLYTHLLRQWDALGADGPFNAFISTGQPGWYGSWGAKRYNGDSNPRADVLIAYNKARCCL